MVPSFCSAIVAPTNSSKFVLGSIIGRKSCFFICVSSSCVFVDDLVCLRVRRRCPLAVAVDSGKYFRTCDEVIGGKPMSWSLSSALHNVSMVGENRHWWMY